MRNTASIPVWSVNQLRCKYAVRAAELCGVSRLFGLSVAAVTCRNCKNLVLSIAGLLPRIQCSSAAFTLARGVLSLCTSLRNYGLSEHAIQEP